MKKTRFNQEKENLSNSSKKITFEKVKKQVKRNYINSVSSNNNSPFDISGNST